MGYFAPVAFGNGCTQTREFVVISLELYASQCPSRENVELRTIADGACAKIVVFLSLSFRDKIHTAPSVPRVAVNDRYWPSGDQESGMCATPCSGLVNRSAAPTPSARCQKMARSP